MFPPLRLAPELVFMTFQTAAASLFHRLPASERDSVNGNTYNVHFCFCQDDSGLL